MGTIKDRNSIDLTEAEDIKKRGKNTQNYTKKIFMTQTSHHHGMIPHLEPDLLECKAKDASVWTKMVEVMEFQLSSFKS